jgi:citrate lyase subunit beta/citryl-CoA lyase
MDDHDISARPLRSLLYVPGSNPRAIDKARTLPCDAVFLDLEDAVVPEAKDAARRAAVEAVREGGFGHRILLIRCNGLDTPWGAEDWAAAAEAAPDGVLAPKVADGAAVEAYDRALAAAPARTRLWVMIETASAILNLGGIAASSRTTRLAALVVGTNDLALDLRCRRRADRAPLLPALALSVAAARAYGLVALDGVFNDFEDEAGFESEAVQGAELGFDGKTLIHPRQVEACNRIFGPTAEQLDWARRVVEAFAAPEAAGKGAIRMGGAMVERLHLAQAERLLAN